MEAKNIIGILAILSFLAILFMPTDSKTWVWFLILGVVFGLVWWIKK